MDRAKRCNISSDEDISGVKEFMEAMQSTSEIVPSTVKTLKEYRESARALSGISGDLNNASVRLVSVIGSFIGKIENYGRICKELKATAAKKLP